MRCVCCNRNLNDYESTLKHANTGAYLDTCNRCLNGLNIPTVGNSDFETTEAIEQEVIEYPDYEIDNDD